MLKKLFHTIILTTIAMQAIGQTDTSDASFYKVYTRVLSVFCALAACHDGSFEPDFRTPQSAYYTTVYHPVVKNNAKHSFKYRITPYSTASSLLYERITNCCFVNTHDRMPLTILATNDTLSGQEIALIGRWIKGGAKDLCGNVPNLPRIPPSVVKNYMVTSDDKTALYEDHFGNGSKHNRLEDKPYKSLIIPSSKVKNVKMQFTIANTDQNPDFASVAPVLAVSAATDYSSAKAIKLSRSYNSYTAEIDPNQFVKNKIYYMRIEMSPKDADKKIVFPNDDSQHIDKLYWSFIVR